MQDTSLKKFKNIVKEDNFSLKQDLVDKPATIEEYVESWQVCIWEPRFISMFCGKDAFSKAKAFKETKLWNLTIKRVIYRYAF